MIKNGFIKIGDTVYPYVEDKHFYFLDYPEMYFYNESVANKITEDSRKFIHEMLLEFKKKYNITIKNINDAK